MNIYKAVEHIAAQQSASDIIEAACSEISAVAKADVTAFYVWDADTSTLVKQIEHGTGNLNLAEQIRVSVGRKSRNVLSRVIRNKQAELQRYGASGKAISVSSTKVAWEAVVPINPRENLYGVFIATAKESVTLRRTIVQLHHIGRMVSIHLAEKLYMSQNTLELSEDILAINAIPTDKIPDYTQFYQDCFAILRKVEPSLVYASIWLCAAEYARYDKMVLRAVSDSSFIPARDYQKVNISDAAIGSALSGKKPKYWKSVRQIKRFHNPDVQRRYGHCQLLAIPLQRIGGIPVGLITLYLPDTCSNVKERIPEFQAYANHVGAAIVQTILTEKRASVEDIFRVTTEFVAADPDLTQLDGTPDFFEDLSSKLRDAIGVGGLSVFFKETQVSERLILFATSGVQIPDDWVGIPYIDISDAGLTTRVATDRRPYIEDDIQKAMEVGRSLSHFPEVSTKPDLRDIWLGTPIFSEEEVIGVIRCLGKESHVPNMVNFFNDDDMGLANLVGSLFLLVRNLQRSEHAVMFGTTLTGHDMRNTLGTVLTAARMLHDEISDKTPGIDNLFDDIKASVTLLTFLTRAPDVFYYWEPEYERVGFMGDVLAPVVGLMMPLIRETGLDIWYDSMEFRQMPLLWLDGQRMQQVAYNLLLNSVKYTPLDSTNKQISVRYRGRENGYFLIDFEDYGIGLKEEDIPRIFEIGERTEEARKVSFEGTGKGLPAALVIARKHGGDIVVENLKDPTTFRLILPTSLTEGAPS